MTRVALLWHMHQPYYEDLATREHILPWVRLHALKDYYGMVALLREFPDVRMTFNLVPSLLVQLEAFAADHATDRFLELSLKPADALDEHDVDFVLEHFFHAQRQRMIDAYPRYGELLARRGAMAPTPAERRAVAARFDAGDLRDLQVWHKLAWIDPLYLDDDPRVRALVAKGRGFSEDDKRVLREVELELLNKVIPEYREAVQRGQIEVSASPFYHPILPLLCDTDIYLRTHPDARRPRQPFRRPEDAADQLAARRGLPYAAVRRAAARPLAIGRIRVRCDGAAGRRRRVPVDGDRRNDPGAHAGHHLHARRPRACSNSPNGSTRPTSSAPATRPWRACSAITCCRI